MQDIKSCRGSKVFCALAKRFRGNVWESINIVLVSVSELGINFDHIIQKVSTYCLFLVALYDGELFIGQ